jgi:VRR-NUC domain
VPKRTIKKAFGRETRSARRPDDRVAAVPQKRGGERATSLLNAAPRCKSRRRARSIIDAYGIEVIALKAAYVANPGRRALILDDSQSCGVEEYVCRYFSQLGYSTAILENNPIHVLFGTFMWPVIQDAGDRRGRIVGFPDRQAYDAARTGEFIWSRLPADFGKPEYAIRRAKQIKKHMAAITAERHDLRSLFDRWLRPSSDLRNYLWAHRAEHIQVARQLIEIVPADALMEVLRYLIEHYWGRYSGWPDLLVHRQKEFMLVEVKSARDTLGGDQQRWIRDNHERLHLPFKLVAVGSMSHAGGQWSTLTRSAKVAKPATAK